MENLKQNQIPCTSWFRRGFGELLLLPGKIKRACLKSRPGTVITDSLCETVVCLMLPQRQRASPAQPTKPATSPAGRTSNAACRYKIFRLVLSWRVVYIQQPLSAPGGSPSSWQRPACTVLIHRHDLLIQLTQEATEHPVAAPSSDQC